MSSLLKIIGPITGHQFLRYSEQHSLPIICQFRSTWMPQRDLLETDPELFEILGNEKFRQKSSLVLIASENFVSKAVLQALGSAFTNKYSTGLVGQRWYGGNQYVDELEKLTQKRALEAFHLNPEQWGVNVQPLSGVPANIAVYAALAGPGGRIMGLDLPHGGHMSHGYCTNKKKKISLTSVFFESMPYKVNQETHLVDFAKLLEYAKVFKPRLIIAGVTCYPRFLDYSRFRQVTDEVGATLMADMAHTSGLVAAGLAPSPFEHCDIVTTTVHKTLRGPRAGMIFYRKGIRKGVGVKKDDVYELEQKINSSVSPGLQGAPHNNAIAATAVALKEAMTPEFVAYQQQVLTNSKILCESLKRKGYKMMTDGTDTHLFLIDLRPLNTNGARVEMVLERINIAVNKNQCPWDKSAKQPTGIRLGTPALTSRNMSESDMETVAEFVHQGIQLTLEAQVGCGSTIEDFEKKLNAYQAKNGEIARLRLEVEKFALNFPMPGDDN